jgi:hypothetical protein
MVNPWNVRSILSLRLNFPDGINAGQLLDHRRDDIILYLKLAVEAPNRDNAEVGNG